MIGRLLLTLILLLTAGCVDSTAPPDRVRMGVASPASNLDPRFATDATSSRVARLLYRRLVDFDAQGRPVPALAQWRKLSPTHYRLRLDSEGRTFADGSRLTAEDVKATYTSVLDPATASPHRTTLTLIQRIEVLDQDTLDFFIDRPDPLFPAYLVLGILPAHAIVQKQAVNEHPIGSGPFELAEWRDDGTLLLRARDDGRMVELVTVKDPTVRTLKLLRGEIDLLQNDLPPELYRYLDTREGLVLRRRRGSNFTYLGFNMQDPATSDPRVRRAVAHAIDRSRIIRYVLNGGARMAETLLPPEHWAGNPELEPIRYDPDEARRLLREAGYSARRPLRLVYKTSTDPFRVRLATIIQHQLAEVGIEAEVRSYDWGTFFGDIKAGRFQMYSLSWVGIRTPDVFRYVFHSTSLPPQGANRGRYASPEVDRLIEAAESATTLEAQAPLYREIQRRIHDDLPYVPLWYEDQVVVSRRGIRGYRLAADGNYDGLLDVRRMKREGR